MDVYDGDQHVRCLHTPSYPAALTFMCVLGPSAAQMAHACTSPPSGCAHGPGTVVACAEACHMALYDIRADGGCVSRFGGTSSAVLRCVAAATPPPGGTGPTLLAAVGADRCLSIYDARSSKALRSLTSLGRRDVSALCFLPGDPRRVLAAATDYELLCRRWDAAAPRAPPAFAFGREEEEEEGAGGGDGFGFRGEARWLGIACAGETMVAYCASGSLYAARLVAEAPL